MKPLLVTAERHKIWILIFACLFFTCCSGQAEALPTATKAPTRTPKAKNTAPPPTVPGLASAAVLGIVVDSEMRIVQVVDGSAADKAGVKSEDFVRSINSQAVNEPLEARKAFFSKSLAQKTKLVVVRSGKLRTFDIKPTILPSPADGEAPTPIPAGMTLF